MAKRGRPAKHTTLEEVRQSQIQSSKKYYEKNKQLICYKAKLKRQQAKKQAEELMNSGE